MLEFTELGNGFEMSNLRYENPPGACTTNEGEVPLFAVGVAEETNASSLTVVCANRLTALDATKNATHRAVSFGRIKVLLRERFEMLRFYLTRHFGRQKEK
jgi:hypothetical protein